MSLRTYIVGRPVCQFPDLKFREHSDPVPQREGQHRERDPAHAPVRFRAGILFVEGNSSDGTFEECERVRDVYKKCWDIKGETQISRFHDRWLLLKMVCFAYRKLKAI